MSPKIHFALVKQINFKMLTTAIEIVHMQI